MTHNKSPSVLIIGAGISGLALANALVRKGLQPIVCERDISPVSRANPVGKN